MKNMRRRLLCLVLCVLVLVSAVPVVHGAPVYFVALNNTLLPLSKSTMPTVINDVLYVPYSVLSVDSTGVNLDVYATYNSVKKQVLVYSSQEQLIFDLQTDATYDGNGRGYAKQAVVRSSTVYLPIDTVCQVFEELDYSLNETQYGYLVRIRNNKVTLSDAAFIDAAASMMKNALQRYEEESKPSNPGGQTPSVSQPAGSGAGVYLAFTLTDNGVDEVLSVLDSQDTQGLFFLTADQLEQWGGLVRRLLGEGHFIGLKADGEDYETVLAELERGRAALAAAAYCRTSMVLAEGLKDAEEESLEQLGYVCWESTVDGRSLEGSIQTKASALMRKMTGGQSARNYLLLDNTVEQLSPVLSVLSREEYHFRAPVAPEL